MPLIYELLGYRSEDRSDAAESSRKCRLCPYTGRACDGGGNRSQSVIRLDDGAHPELRDYFNGADSVQAGVCSIEKTAEEGPWIVCPNRLLCFGEESGASKAGASARGAVLGLCGFLEGSRIGVWRELSMKYSRALPGKGVAGEFDYRLDYVLMPLATVRLDDAAQDLGMSSGDLAKVVERGGYSVITRRNERYIEDYPQGQPVVVELMTCSTSGGNKKKRTQIGQAFEDCLLGRDYQAPGINQRQVLGRTITQLLVKSQAALHWGGKAIWVMQDRLADYISASTALDLDALSSSHASEVNVLSLGYELRRDLGRGGDDGAPLQLSRTGFYSDLVRDEAGENPSFKDVLLGSVFPPRSEFVKKLLGSLMADSFTYSANQCGQGSDD